MPTTADCCDYDFVSKDWLRGELRGGDSRRLVVLDCRSSNEFTESHIRDAVNFSIPSIMLRRLATGKIDLSSTIKCRQLKTKICSTYKENLFILYNDLCRVQQHLSDSVLGVLLKRLSQDGCRVVCLEDGFSRFKDAFPEWCVSCNDLPDGGGGVQSGHSGTMESLPLMGLCSLRITAVPHHPRHPHRSCDSLSSAANSSTDSSDTDDRCDSSLGFEEDREFPVEILPYLYLGNAANSCDRDSLARHNIQYVLNVTPDLPNVFEEHITYMKIPITDHCSQDLAYYFPQAIEFIDEARNNQKGVLVHCLAGISRSVTITVAYLMKKCSLTMNDAFSIVKSRKSNIAPNFHFMHQLFDFEKELKLDEGGGGTVPAPLRGPIKCDNCGLFDAACKCRQHSDFLNSMARFGVSPDSGIEFDRWASSSSTPAE
ncbi:PREDICTED: dual specificity protein phosphatase Mpk3-like [Nicrophorus vespilloides]|uniref:Dual specificity protein phosphatase n=1 Tax=Nicrophorus vespilloides TaxID=110193 RepID=A0ABM1MB66_NICVS|nr:PREDICTED: dual specificity protein phosphatase Mpk3-like [Nicrophorus vespilloides]